jgi:dsDNA-specific endonuclease/ATPase MutS2
VGSEKDDDEGGPVEVVEIEITDSIDLHTFAPRDVKELVTDYLELAAEKGFPEVRIIHGKGIGNLRRIVHSVLTGHPRVESFALADGSRGGWGATLVKIRV